MDTSIVPPKYRALSGSALKVIATLAMFIDHAGILFARELYQIELFTLLGRHVTAYSAMRWVGRIAFPIFCFLLVEGFVHTRNRRAYGLRLGTFALISEVPWNLWHSGHVIMPQSQSVFVTLFLTYCGLCVLEGMRTATGMRERVRSIALMVGLFVALTIVRCDYGSKALGCVLALYLLAKLPLPRAIVASSCLGSPVFALAAFVPIALYNGRRGFIRGRALQLAFYVIYPAHMLVLWWVGTALGV